MSKNKRNEKYKYRDPARNVNNIIYSIIISSVQTAFCALVATNSASEWQFFDDCDGAKCYCMYSILLDESVMCITRLQHNHQNIQFALKIKKTLI